MANQHLKDQFFTALESSASYHLLAPEKQKLVRERFEAATDEQLASGIEELKKDAAETAKRDVEARSMNDRFAEQAHNLWLELKKLKKTALVSNVNMDRSDSEKEAEDLLSKLDKIPEDAGKRKKFLGIF